MNIVKIAIVLLGFAIKRCILEVDLSLEQTDYVGYVGDSIVMTCTGNNLAISDLVWQYFPVESPLSTTVIYLTSRLGHTGNGKYTVASIQISSTSLNSSLTIRNLEMTDANYTYQCACNIYTACASGPKANSMANITVLPKQNAILTTNNFTQDFFLSNQWDLLQCVVLNLTIFTLVLTCILFHFSYNENSIETLFLVFVLMLSAFFLSGSLVLFIKPNVLYDTNVISLALVCFGLFVCFLLWMFVLQYLVRLRLTNELNIVVLAIIGLDGMLEVIAGVVLILANLNFTRIINIPKLNQLTNSYLAVVAATLLLFFAFILLINSIFLFYFYARKRRAEENSSLKRSKTITSSNFIPLSRSSVLSKSSDLIHGLWFSNRAPTNESLIVDKPIRLKPIFSRKYTPPEVVSSSQDTLDIDKSSSQCISVETTNFKTSWDPTDNATTTQTNSLDSLPTKHFDNEKVHTNYDGKLVYVDDLDSSALNRSDKDLLTNNETIIRTDL